MMKYPSRPKLLFSLLTKLQGAPVRWNFADTSPRLPEG